MATIKTLSEEDFNKEWVTFWGNMTHTNLAPFFNEEQLREQMKTAAGGTTTNTGLAYHGGLIRHINLSTAISQRIAKMVSGTLPVDEMSLIKVSLLMHLSKIWMWRGIEDDWQNKRGYMFEFVDLPGNLKFGERSLQIATNLGIKFTEEEWEAMECIAKVETDNGNKYAESSLSTIIRQGNELAYAIEKKRDGGR